VKGFKMSPEQFKFNWLRDNTTKFIKDTESHFYSAQDISGTLSFLAEVEEIELPLTYTSENDLVTVIDSSGSYFGTGETKEEAERYFIGAVLHS
jgi:hypothetical protein